jgi:uncharacterized protein YbjT (DUF2867 family)
MHKTATIIGATGLIGGHLLDLLLNDDHYSRVRIIVRRPFSVSNSKAEVKIIDFEDKEAFKLAIAGSDAVFCAVGTTQKKVQGDKAAYRKVDFDIPVNAARYCKETGVPRFLLVSSVGADSKSGNFYLKLKGEAEDAVKSLGLPSATIFRPSMLLGKRNESRPAESLAQAVSKGLSFLFPGKYKPIQAREVAQGMFAASKKEMTGFNVLHYREITG